MSAESAGLVARLQDLWGRWWPRRWMSEAQLLRHHGIPDSLWRHTLAAYPFLAWRPPERLHRLRNLSTLFLARKQFTPMPGVAFDDAMAVAIAAQACLPILRHGLGAYDAFVGVVIHPDQVVAKRTHVDDAGVVHHYDEVLSGESMPGGPIMLSWHDVEQARETQHGYNVVVHEFMHALDMAHGQADGIPPLPTDLSVREWTETLWQAFDRHNEALAHGDPTWLDPYAAEDGLVEFLPVVAEAFFVAPQRLIAEFPDVYRLLSRFFGEDPITHASP